MSQTFPWLADVTQAAGALSAWTAGALAVLLALLCVVEAIRARRDGWAGGAVRIVLAAIVAAGLVALLAQNGLRERAEARRALETRVAETNARAMQPGSPLGCLLLDTGDALDGACEKAVFANAASVVAAVAFVGARLSLLADARRLGGGHGLGGMTSMADLRRALERDTFGIASHLLATRNGCQVDRCDAYALFTDTGILQINMRGRVFEAYVKRHADEWNESAAAVAKVPDKAPDADRQAGDAAAPQSGSQMGTQGGSPGHMPTKFDFPSAASIPPVSIMNPEPKAAAPAAGDVAGETGSAEPTPVPPKRPQAAEPATRP